MAKKLTGEPNGRPLKFKTVAELEKMIKEYFDYCDNRIVEVHSEKTGEVFGLNKPAPYTISGLALYLGFCEVKSLHDYEKRGEFLHAIKGARIRIEAQDEERLKEGIGGAGLIFVTKNRHGWTDKQQVEQVGNISVNFEGGEV